MAFTSIVGEQSARCTASAIATRYSCDSGSIVHSLVVDLTGQQFGIKPAHELILLVNQDHFRCHLLVGKLKTHQ